MAAGIVRNFFTQAPPPAYLPMIFQHSHSPQDGEQGLEGKSEEREEREEEDEEEEEEEDDEESEVQEEEEEECFLSAPPQALDVTRQLLRFADLISRDVQRYFGRGAGEREGCDIYSDSAAVATSGRLRYYDDLLRIARSGSPEERQSRAPARANDPEVVVAKGNGGLGPLAELFDHRGPSQTRGQPMIKRHLPLSFWSEPVPCCPLDALGPDFSDLLANWDPNPELTDTLTDNTHL
uniref:Proline and glutamate rich with coiled coil 1 n=1 Tax=Salarias fasciatus TaxID=181472 RepID=A0A672GG88_SALFA